MPEGSAVLISTRPALSSRRPTVIRRRASLPFSIVQTKFCPASVLTAIAGKVGTGAPAARVTRPVPNMPPRSAPSGFGTWTNTRMARVPASVVGLMRSIVPVKRRSPKPSMASMTFMPTLSSGVSLAGTIAWSSISVKSTMVTSGASKGTFSPGWTCRLATTPDRGAVTEASRNAIRASWTCASLDLSVPWVTERLLSALSYAVCEMKFCLSSARFCARFFSARASCARLDSIAPMRSLSLASRSAVSNRAIVCPARTVSPSRTIDLAEFAGHLGSDGGLVDRLQSAGHRQPARKRVGLDRGQVGLVELEDDRRRVSRRRSRAIARPHDNGGGERPDDAIATRAPTVRRRVNQLAMSSVSPPRSDRPAVGGFWPPCPARLDAPAGTAGFKNVRESRPLRPIDTSQSRRNARKGRQSPQAAIKRGRDAARRRSPAQQRD